MDAVTAEAADRRRLLLLVVPPILLPVFLAVIDQTIVATALPSIARSLGDVRQIAWVVVAYLVANTIAAPVYGRLGDRYGRRRMMLVSLVLFIAASGLCAVSASLPMLTAARVAQGLGGGGLMTLSQALIGESVPVAERGRFQGYLSAVIVASSSFGPVAGGYLTAWFGWPSIFLVNLPLGAIAVLLVLRLPAQSGGGRLQFDTLGTVLLTAFIAPLLMALEALQHFDAAGATQGAALLAVAVVALALLIFQQGRAPDPLLSPALLRQPTIWRCNVMAACSGASLVALVTFLPIYLEVVDGAGPGEIGFLLLPLTAGVGFGSMLTGRLVGWTGRTALFPGIGPIVTVTMLALAAIFAPSLSRAELPWLLAIACFFQGTAMPVSQIVVQLVAGRAALGAASGGVQLSRSLGSALGVAIVGGALFAALAAVDPATARLFAVLVERGPGALAALPAATASAVRGEITNAYRIALLANLTFPCGILACAWTLPHRRITATRHPA